MASFERPKPVWISPAVIGESPRKRKLSGPEPTTSHRPLNPRALSFDAEGNAQRASAAEHDVGEVPAMTELAAGQVESSAIELSPAMIPLPESDSDESPTPDSERITLQEALAFGGPDATEPLTGASQSIFSPTFSDQAISAAWVWTSPFIAEYERWTVVKANLKTMELIPRSPHVPRTFAEWLTHRAEMADIKAKEMHKQIGHKETMAALGSDRVRAVPTFGGATFEKADNGVGRSGVGAEQTIWSPWTKPTDDRPQADWPSEAEMREEGDERNTSGFGRFPALPRVNGNETVNYKYKTVITATTFDMVWPPPNPRTDQEAEELDDDYALHLIGNVLGAALDAD